MSEDRAQNAQRREAMLNVRTGMVFALASSVTPRELLNDIHTMLRVTIGPNGNVTFENETQLAINPAETVKKLGDISKRGPTPYSGTPTPRNPQYIQIEDDSPVAYGSGNRPGSGVFSNMPGSGIKRPLAAQGSAPQFKRMRSEVPETPSPRRQLGRLDSESPLKHKGRPVLYSDTDNTHPAPTKEQPAHQAMGAPKLPTASGTPKNVLASMSAHKTAATTTATPAAPMGQATPKRAPASKAQTQTQAQTQAQGQTAGFNQPPAKSTRSATSRAVQMEDVQEMEEEEEEDGNYEFMQ